MVRPCDGEAEGGRLGAKSRSSRSWDVLVEGTIQSAEEKDEKDEEEAVLLNAMGVCSV